MATIYYPVIYGHWMPSPPAKNIAANSPANAEIAIIAKAIHCHAATDIARNAKIPKPPPGSHGNTINYYR
jgi:hypothetical protein